jgi:hypothetical protein
MEAEHRVTASPAVPARGAFQVGIHLVQVSCAAGRWTASLDGVLFEQWFTSQADAWEAAVRAADRLDRGAR